MKAISLAGSLAVILTLSACSSIRAPTHAEFYGNPVVATVDGLYYDTTHGIQYFAGQAVNSISQKTKILSMPKVQPVTIVGGSLLADSKAVVDRNAPYWKPERTHGYTVKLADGSSHTLYQGGPQFYQGQKVLLVKRGMTLNLVP